MSEDAISGCMAVVNQRMESLYLAIDDGPNVENAVDPLDQVKFQFDRVQRAIDKLGQELTHHWAVLAIEGRGDPPS